MGRRWWIASGVLLGVLALISVLVTRASDATVAETSAVFTGVVYGPEPWAPGPAVVLGGLLVVAGLLVAVAAVAYTLGRRHSRGPNDTSPSPIGTDVEPDAEAVPTTTGSTTGRRSWALPAALSLALTLVAGGLVLVVTDASSGYTLTNGARGIAPLDNVAAIPSGDGIISLGVVGVVPEVAGLRYDDAVLTLEQAGFVAIEVRDRDGGQVPDGVAADRVVDRVLPEPGTMPPSGTSVVLFLR